MLKSSLTVMSISRPRVGDRWRLTLLPIASALLTALTFMPAIEGAQTPQPTPGPPRTAKVILLPPVVAAGALSSDGRTGGLAGGIFGGAAPVGGSHRSKLPVPGSFEAVLVNNATARLAAHGYTLLSLESVQDPNAADWFGQLELLTSRLARGAINDEAREVLSHLATLPDEYLVFVQYMEVKQGPGGSWNPNTGAITSQMSSTLVRTALISTRTGTVIWKAENLERKLYRPDDHKFAKVLDQLYSTLENQGGTR